LVKSFGGIRNASERREKLGKRTGNGGKKKVIETDTLN